ncbi:hypothetical protein [Myceligenerans crystallogenes]|uniref:Uncharacterized protein n=1 Tax=Myceligenerans crystallogenes TaxID=316335 RepID=A0ABN2N9V7_9MICO
MSGRGIFAQSVRSAERKSRFSLVGGMIVVVGAAICVVAIVLEPEEGRSFVDVAAMLLSYIGLILVIQQSYTQFMDVPEPASRTAWDRVWDLATKRPRIAIAALVILILSGTYLTWYYTSASGQVVTGHITASKVTADGTGPGARPNAGSGAEPAGLTDCYPAGGRETGKRNEECAAVRIQVPGEPPARGHVDLTPVLQNEGTTGSCVSPAHIVLTPVVDGVVRPGVTGSSGHSVDVPIDNATRDAYILAEIDNQHDDAECKVTLTITRAVLHD